MNKTSTEEMEINGAVYVRKDSEQSAFKNTDGLEYCTVRTYSAGVFAGYIDRKVSGKSRTVFQARRLWRWEGAASLSELATKGLSTSKLHLCKFPAAVSEVDLEDVIEIIPCTEKARISIGSVKIWSANVD